MVKEDNLTYQSESTVTGGTLADLKPGQRTQALRGAQLLAKALRSEVIEMGSAIYGVPGRTLFRPG